MSRFISTMPCPPLDVTLCVLSVHCGMRDRFGAAVISFVCTISVAAAAPAQHEINDLYRRGLAGDKAAVEQCIGILEQTLKAEPTNQLARVYLGSAYTLRSRDLGFGPKKLQVLKQGVAVMNEAVAAAPNDAKVRLARALTTDALPGILGYKSESRRDFAELAAMAQRSPEKFAEGDLQIVYYNAGLAAHANGEHERAVTFLKQAQAHRVDAALAKKVDAQLASP
jgi:hypothetical protein